MFLLDLPPEIHLLILSHLKTAPLLCSASVCKYLNGLVSKNDHLFADVCGRGPYHRPWIHKSDRVSFRQLVREKREWESEQSSTYTEVWTAKECIDQLLKNNYLCNQQTIGHVSRHALLSLQRHDPCGEDWYEAAATAFVAQERMAEAEHMYDALTHDNKSLPPRTLLTATRFGWFTPDLPQLDARVLWGTAVLGAAAGGHVASLRLLRQAGAPLAYTEGPDCAASLAAEGGHLAVLKYLQQAGHDISANDENVLRGAAKYGHLEVVEYLLSTQAATPTGVAEAFCEAIRWGHPPILKTLHYHLCQQDRRRWLKMAAHSDTPVALKYLVGELGFDIDATIDEGRLPIHVAAMRNAPQHVSAMLELGASLHSTDATGQTALEIALSHDHHTIVALLAPCEPDYDLQLRATKIALARRLRECIYSITIAMTSRTLGARFDNTRVEMLWNKEKLEEKLCALYAREFSVASLHYALSALVDGPLDQAYPRLMVSSLAVLACDHNQVLLIQSEVRKDAQEVCRSFMPSLQRHPPCCIDRVLDEVIASISIEHIRAFKSFIEKPEGSQFSTAMKNKSLNEALIYCDFKARAQRTSRSYSRC